MKKLNMIINRMFIRRQLRRCKQGKHLWDDPAGCTPCGTSRLILAVTLMVMAFLIGCSKLTGTVSILAGVLTAFFVMLFFMLG